MLATASRAHTHDVFCREYLCIATSDEKHLYAHKGRAVNIGAAKSEKEKSTRQVCTLLTTLRQCSPLLASPWQESENVVAPPPEKEIRTQPTIHIYVVKTMRMENAQPDAMCAVQPLHFKRLKLNVES